MKFKDQSAEKNEKITHRINRIRLKFKEDWEIPQGERKWVLIESDWNLKKYYAGIGADGKISINRIRLKFKDASTSRLDIRPIGINRIRLEFKGKCSGPDMSSVYGINRIRLEFKVAFDKNSALFWLVLIESDWNLKLQA